MQVRQTSAGIAMALDAAGMLQSPETAAEAERLRTERDRYRTAWRRARTRAVATGSAADRYAARAREFQTAAQDLLAALLDAQVQRNELRARVAELEQQAANVRALHVRYPDSDHCTQDDEQWPCLTLCALGAAGRSRLVHDDEPPLTAAQAEARRLELGARMRAAGGDIP
ncbi:hypothetical protein [Streptomyces noursei]|uniref:hypothetical protein n=1 Tax=Streptomyces noursei TaxID=1971 RepID=UPI0023B8052F|nr:hypothetical protein [Streptomyces noursei]